MILATSPFLTWLDSQPLWFTMALMFLSWSLAMFFLRWGLRELRESKRQNDNKGSYGTNEVKTHHCNGCSQEVSRIAFQCCTSCMVDLLNSLDQHFTIEDADEETAEIKVAIAKGEER